MNYIIQRAASALKTLPHDQEKSMPGTAVTTPLMQELSAAHALALLCAAHASRFLDSAAAPGWNERAGRYNEFAQYLQHPFMGIAGFDDELGLVFREVRICSSVGEHHPENSSCAIHLLLKGCRRVPRVACSVHGFLPPFELLRPFLRSHSLSTAFLSPSMKFLAVSFW